MSKINELIAELCPDGVEFKELWRLTHWDKRFNGTNKHKQPKVKKFKHISAADLKALAINNGNIKLLATGKFDGWTTDELAGHNINSGEVITIPSGGAANLKYYKGDFVDSGNILAVSADAEKYELKFIYYYLLNINETIQNLFRGSGVAHPAMGEILELKIPVPPLEIQRVIVGVLDSFMELEAELEAELEVRKKQYEFYRNQLLTFSERERVTWKTLGEIGKVSMCKRIMKDQTKSIGDIPFYKIGTFGKTPNAYISRDIYDEYRRKFSFPKKGDVLLSASGTIGRTVVYDGEPGYFQDSNIIWLDNDEKQVTNKFLLHLYKIVTWQTEGGTIKRLYNDNFNKIQIPVPPIEEQNRIVSILDKFERLTTDISEGLPAELNARRKQYEYYRNKLLTFTELAHA